MKASETELVFPCSIPAGSYQDGKYLITHAIWRNSYGSVQPESGIRFAQPDASYGDFRLIQHGWLDFSKAEQVILHALGKGWGVLRIEDFMCRLRERHPRAASLSKEREGV